jgi:hypothetical protein
VDHLEEAQRGPDDDNAHSDGDPAITRLAGGLAPIVQPCRGSVILGAATKDQRLAGIPAIDLGTNERVQADESDEGRDDNETATRPTFCSMQLR